MLVLHATAVAAFYLTLQAPTSLLIHPKPQAQCPAVKVLGYNGLSWVGGACQLALLTVLDNQAIKYCNSWNLQVKIWNVQSGFCFVTFSDHTAPVTAVAFLPSGSVVVSASLDGTVRAFDLVRYRNFRTMTSPHPVQFVSLAVDPAGEVKTAPHHLNPASTYVFPPRIHLTLLHRFTSPHHLTPAFILAPGHHPSTTQELRKSIRPPPHTTPLHPTSFS